jgi:hypothetical protein
MNNGKRSIYHRIVAAGFIIMTIAGNFWLVNLIMSTEVSPYVLHSFEIGMILVALGGVGMLWSYFRSRISPEQPSDTE